MAKNTLTKEELAKLFPDNFQLTIFAIGQAQQQINSGNVDLNLTELLRQIRKAEVRKLKVADQEEVLEHLTPND